GIAVSCAPSTPPVYFSINSIISNKRGMAIALQSELYRWHILERLQPLASQVWSFRQSSRSPVLPPEAHSADLLLIAGRAPPAPKINGEAKCPSKAKSYSSLAPQAALA